MRRRLNLAVVAGLVLAVVAAGLVVGVLRSANTTVRVWVAVTTIAPRKQIPASAVAADEMKPADVPAGSITTRSAIVGHYALSTIFPGQTFLPQALATSSNEAAVITNGLGPGERAFALQANVAEALAGRIQPYDRVDIVCVYAPGGGGGGSSADQASTIIQQATVLGINLSASAIASQAQTTSATSTNPSNSASQRVTVPGIYTVALTPAQVQEVALAETVGTLFLSLDPVGKVQRYAGTPSSPTSLGTTSMAPTLGSAKQPGAVSAAGTGVGTASTGSKNRAKTGARR